MGVRDSGSVQQREEIESRADLRRQIRHQVAVGELEASLTSLTWSLVQMTVYRETSLASIALAMARPRPPERGVSVLGTTRGERWLKRMSSELTLLHHVR